jgi:hypothetical protein
MKLVITVLLAALAYGQSPVRDIPFGCSSGACKTILDYSGSTLIYSGVAAQFLGLPNTWLKRSDSTLTSITISSNVGTATCASACGTFKGQRVAIAGATVDADLNNTWTVTSNTDTSATTFTFATSSVSDCAAGACATEATLTISTSNPLTTQPFWTVTALKYDGSSNLTDVNIWPNIAWSARTTY